MSHPVRLAIERPPRMNRIHVFARLAILVLAGSVRWGSAYALLYLGLPVVVALLVSRKGAARYLSESATGVARVLRWIAAAYAYLWLLTDTLPTNEDAHAIDLNIEASGAPTVGSALLRVLTSLPALVVLVVVTLVGGLLWLIGILAILATGHVPEPIATSLAQILRYRMRFIAYHLSLVAEYPSFEDVPAPHVPRMGAA